MKAPARRRLSLTAALLAIAGWAHSATPGSGRAVLVLPTLPAGTTLPVQLAEALHAGKVAPGLVLHANTTQRVPLGGQVYLPSGVQLEGRVAASAAHSLTLQFDTIKMHGQSQAVSMQAIALASFVAVSATSAPANGSTDRGNPSPASWTTEQVGGDQVVRSGWSGPLVNSVTHTVGSADYWGVYTLPATPITPPHALGPFSAKAAGLFGFASDCTLLQPELTISCATSRPTLHRGDVILLEVE